jgi:seryl-tRNA synthetase
MIDPKLLRQNPEPVIENLARRGYQLNWAAFEEAEGRRKDLQNKTQELQMLRNQISKKVGEAKARKEDTSELLAEVGLLGNALKENEAQLEAVQKELLNLQLDMPNLLHDSVPSGRSEKDNQEIRHWGKPKDFDFTPKDHVDLGEGLDLLNFEDAAKLSGARFTLLKGRLARLHRALAQFMLNLHTQEHGYREMYVPYLVKSEILYGTGQLPKFEADLFGVKGERDFYLIPTS